MSQSQSVTEAPGSNLLIALIARIICLYSIDSTMSEELWWVSLVARASFLRSANCMLSFGRSQSYSIGFGWGCQSQCTHKSTLTPALGAASTGEKSWGLQEGDMEEEPPKDGG